MKNRIKFWRLQLQAKEGRTITQGELGEMCALPRETISRYEGQKQQPDIDNLVALWRFYKTYFKDINLQDLLEIE